MKNKFNKKKTFSMPLNDLINGLALYCLTHENYDPIFELCNNLLDINKKYKLLGRMFQRAIDIKFKGNNK